jgi:hypothetical protein
MTGHAGIAANPVEPQRVPAFCLPPNHVGAQRDRRLILISEFDHEQMADWSRRHQQSRNGWSLLETVTPKQLHSTAVTFAWAVPRRLRL